MDLLTAGRVLARRRLMLGLLLVVAAGAVAAVYWEVPTTYQVSATLLVLPPTLGGVYQAPTPAVPTRQPAPPTAPPRLVNPYLSFDTSTFIVARVTTQALGSDAERHRIALGGGSADYQATTSSDEPIISITVTDHDRRREVRTLHSLIGDAGAQLTSRQQATGMPAAYWAQLTPIVVADQPSGTNQKLKVSGGAAALALVAVLAAVFAFDGIATARRLRVAHAASRPRHGTTRTAG